MENILQTIYKRYNQFGHYYDSITVPNPFWMIKLYKASKKCSVNIEQEIMSYMRKDLHEKTEHYQELLTENEFIQPKSVFIRIYILNIIAHSIPEEFYKNIMYNANSIVEISLAITLYYLGLQTYMYAGKDITETEKKNLIGRTDFYFTLNEIQKVRGKTSKEELKRYLDIFAKDIMEISENDKMGLFLDEGTPFLICIEEFLDYLIFQLEDYFKNKASNAQYSLYTDKKGESFEQIVYEITKQMFQESYHTLYYYPNKKQKMESDVLLRDKQNIAIIECKSGTFNVENLKDDELIKLQISNKTKKAYRTLKQVIKYLNNTEEYCFKCEDQIITGPAEDPICIHLSMYPMDFIASNMHVLFPQYFEEKNPIFSISLEHFFAMILDAKINNKDIFAYWKKRKRDIQEYPDLYFDNNELDLYYEIVNEDNDTMLAEIKRQGILEQLAPNAKIMSSFHNEFGEEIRPAQVMLKTLDSFLLTGIFKKGKSWFNINRRYLKNLEEYLLIR